MIYPEKRSQGLRPSTSETTLSVQEEEKDTIVHQLSTPTGVKKSLKYLPRGVKKSLKSLLRGVRKAVNNIKHYKTTADSVPEFPTLYGDDIKGRKRRRELSSPACGTIFTERRSTCRSVCCQQSSCCSNQKNKRKALERWL